MLIASRGAALHSSCDLTYDACALRPNRTPHMTAYRPVSFVARLAWFVPSLAVATLLTNLVSVQLGGAFAADAAVIAAPPSPATSAPRAELLFAGTLRPRNTVPADGSAPEELKVSPRVSFAFLGPLPLKRTDVIAARVGEHFGLLFVPEAGASELRYIIRWPAAGNQGTRVVDDTGLFCLDAVVCNASFDFEKPSEILPGDWDIEVRTKDGHLLVQHTFHVRLADPAQPPTTVDAVLPDVIEVDGDRHAMWTWALEPWLAIGDHRERLSRWYPVRGCPFESRRHRANWSLVGDRLMLDAVVVRNCTASPSMVPLEALAPDAHAPVHATWVSGDIVIEDDHPLSVAPPLPGLERKVLMLTVRDGIVQARQTRAYGGEPLFAMRPPRPIPVR